MRWASVTMRPPSGCSDHPIMPQEGVQLGGPAAEGDERLQGWPTAAARQDFIAKAGADGRRQYAFLLEQAERVRRQHFGPLVAVIAGRVSPCEHMRERLDE